MRWRCGGKILGLYLSNTLTTPQADFHDKLTKRTARLRAWTLASLATPTSHARDVAYGSALQSALYGLSVLSPPAAAWAEAETQWKRTRRAASGRFHQRTTRSWIISRLSGLAPIAVYRELAEVMVCAQLARSPSLIAKEVNRTLLHEPVPVPAALQSRAVVTATTLGIDLADIGVGAGALSRLATVRRTVKAALMHRDAATNPFYFRPPPAIRLAGSATKPVTALLAGHYGIGFPSAAQQDPVAADNAARPCPLCLSGPDSPIHTFVHCTDYRLRDRLRLPDEAVAAICSRLFVHRHRLRKTLKAPARSAIRFLKTAMAVRKDALSTQLDGIPVGEPPGNLLDAPAASLAAAAATTALRAQLAGVEQSVQHLAASSPIAGEALLLQRELANIQRWRLAFATPPPGTAQLVFDDSPPVLPESLAEMTIRENSSGRS